MLFDTYSGLGAQSSAEKREGAAWIPKVVRYPKKMKLVVNLSNLGDELLDVPYL